MKDKKRYSEAFKLKVMEELRDGKWKTVADAAQAYGVSAQGVRYWMKRLGFEHLNGRIIYVKTTSEIDEIKRLKAELYHILAEHSGQTFETIEKDCDRDHYMTAQEALEYGMIDKIFTRTK